MLTFFGEDVSLRSGLNLSSSQPEDAFGYPTFRIDQAFDLPQYSLFPLASVVPDGAQLIDQRSNTSFWDFDQSNLKASIEDVLGSVFQAAKNTLIAGAGDLIRTGTQNENPWLRAFAKNFQSTLTGAQIQAQGQLNRVQQFLANPTVWIVAGVGLVVMLFLSLRR